jgi:IMP dehydrogenase
MTPAENCITRTGKVSLEDAYKIMSKSKVKTLPILKRSGQVDKLYLYSDAKRIISSSELSNIDANGRLYTAAAVPTDSEAVERVRAMRKYLDVAVIDSADGDSYYAFHTLKMLKKEFPDLDVVVGNVSEAESALLLAKAGADGIKVGQGPGSICTTRIETGIGMPQVTAVWECFNAIQGKYDIPIIADGGIRNHGDISIAIAAGAECVMMGSMLAGTTEAPGEVITRNDGTRVKKYRGMGSASALEDSAASRKRYGANGDGKPLAEGIESLVPFKGDAIDTIETCLKALTKSMRYCKANDLDQHRFETRFIRITNAGLAESHPHIRN